MHCAGICKATPIQERAMSASSSGKAQSVFRDRAACLTVLGVAHRYVLGSSIPLSISSLSFIILEYRT